jgi:hypothetical protein
MRQRRIVAKQSGHTRNRSRFAAALDGRDVYPEATAHSLSGLVLRNAVSSYETWLANSP